MQVAKELSENKERNILSDDPELEKIRAESVAAKEELNSYREKAEKLNEQLMVRTEHCHNYFIFELMNACIIFIKDCLVEEWYSYSYINIHDVFPHKCSLVCFCELHCNGHWLPTIKI